VLKKGAASVPAAWPRCLPTGDAGGRLGGILGETDLLSALATLLGSGRRRERPQRVGDELERLVRGLRCEREAIAARLDRYHALDAPLIVGDVTRLHDDTGWSPRYAMKQTLEDLLNDWRRRV